MEFKSRISKTIAAARATLDEPSRPFTPSNLDSRMSLDSGSRAPLANKSKSRLKLEALSRNIENIPSSSKSNGKISDEQQSFITNLNDLRDTIRSIELETTHYISAVGQETINSHMNNIADYFGKIKMNLHCISSSVLENDVLSVGNDVIDLLSKWTGEFVTKIDPQLPYLLIVYSTGYYLDLIKLKSDPKTLNPIPIHLGKPLRRIMGMAYNFLSRTQSSFDSRGSELHTQLLEFLVMLWKRLQIHLEAELKKKSKASDSDSSESELLVLLEICKYSAGIIRLMSRNENDQKILVAAGVIEIVATGFSILCTSVSIRQLIAIKNQNKAEYHTLLLDTIVDIVVQLLGAVRNFSMETKNHTQLLEFDVVCLMCCLMTVFLTFPNVLLNCARATAKLSLYEPFRAQINHDGKPKPKTGNEKNVKEARKGMCIKSLSDIIVRQAEECEKIMNGTSTNVDGEWPAWHTWLLLSRVCFTLGNLTTTNSQNRRLIGVSFKVRGSLVTLLQACSGSLSELHNRGIQGDDAEDQDEDNDNSFVVEDTKDDNAAEEELRDATIKLLRLLANISIESEIGLELASNIDTIEILLDLLRSTTEEERHEELLLNTVAACTNITFFAAQQCAQYEKDDSNGKDNKKLLKMDIKLVELSLALTQCLFHVNEEIVLETTRVLGNLTRRPLVLKSVVKNRTDEALILLLNHNFDIVTSVVGTLVNLSADSTSRVSLLSTTSNVFEKFATLLRKTPLRYVQAHILICQVLHNLLMSGVEELRCRTDFADISYSIQGSLTEKVEIVEDYVEEEYISFVRVAKVVSTQLFTLQDGKSKK